MDYGILETKDGWFQNRTGDEAYSPVTFTAARGSCEFTPKSMYERKPMPSVLAGISNALDDRSTSTIEEHDLERRQHIWIGEQIPTEPLAPGSSCPTNAALK